MKKVTLTLMLNFIVSYSFSQVKFTEKVLLDSGEADFPVLLMVKIPMWLDTSSFFEYLNESLDSLYWPKPDTTSIPFFDSVFLNPETSEEFIPSWHETRGYNILCNSKTFLSFNIFYESYGDGSEQVYSIDNYIIDLKNKTKLTFDSFFAIPNKKKVMALVAKKLNKEEGFGAPKNNPDNPLEFDICITDSTIVFYYSFEQTGSIVAYTSVEFKLNEILIYMRPKRQLQIIALMKSREHTVSKQ